LVRVGYVKPLRLLVRKRVGYVRPLRMGSMGVRIKYGGCLTRFSSHS
jgi:hypothetical protein